MTRASDVPEDLLSAVRGLPIDPSYIRYVIEDLTAIGSSPLGFRNTGTPEDQAVAAFVSAELRDIGLSDVAVEKVDVDAWRFHAASVRVGGADSDLIVDGCSFGGVPPTPRGGVTSHLIDVGDPTRRRLDRLDLRGAIVLADWKHKAVPPSVFVIELARRGIAGVVVNCPTGGAWFQGIDALGAFDGSWPTAAPTMVMVRKEDAARLRAASTGAVEVTMTLDAEIARHAAGHNIVGYLPGESPGPIVVGAHHDAWFRGAFDNTSGVGALLAIARAMAGTGWRPRHTICFTSRTAEEYGITDTAFDWCIGAWHQIQTTHPEWQAHSPFHLCLEASGHPQLRTIVEAPVELQSWARRICKAAAAEGWTPTGWRVAPPVAATEQWPFLISGVPSVAAYAWETAFADTDYHTQRDTIDSIDVNIVADQARLYSLLLMAADRDPDVILDHRARARQLAKIAASQGHAALAEAASRHHLASGRRAFTQTGRSLLALDARMGASYPHAQALKNLEALDAAIAAIDDNRADDAARALGKVGSHSSFRYLSDEGLKTYDEQFTPEAVARSWGAGCHLTQSPHLWAELASLRGQPPARPLGAWVRTSLVRARIRTQKDLDRRLDAMARSLRVTRTPKG
jgi:Peptidase family M28